MQKTEKNKNMCADTSKNRFRPSQTSGNRMI